MPYVDCRTCKHEGCQRNNGNYGYTMCNDHKGSKPTNADRIRAMNDEELAEFMFSMQKSIWNALCNKLGWVSYAHGVNI